MRKFLGFGRVGKRQLALNLLQILLGCAVSAVGINAFLVPHKFLSGGLSGLSLLISYLTPLSVATLVIILNIPIFILGWFRVGRAFIVGSLVGMLSFAGFLYATGWMASTGWAPERLLSAILGGTMAGGGGGLVLRANASLGGMDIVAAAIKKHFSYSVGTVNFYVNACIVVALGAIFGVHAALYTVVANFCSSFALDRAMIGLNKRRMLFIISERPDEIADQVMAKLGRGVTFLSGEGAYTGRRQKVIYCVVTLRQLARVKLYVRSIDPGAFMSVAEVSEVAGHGFKALPI